MVVMVGWVVVVVGSGGGGGSHRCLTTHDATAQVNDGWLEPLLDRIVRNRRVIAMPVIDVIDMNTFEVKQAIVEKVWSFCVLPSFLL
jgi:hypothetical protein